MASLTEFKLNKIVLEMGSSEEIPSYIKTKQCPAEMETVNAMQVGDKHNVFFISDSGYRVLTVNGHTGEEIFSEHMPYTNIHA